MGWGIYPDSSAYSLSKLVNLQMSAYVAAESQLSTAKQNVTSVALHPGIVQTDMVLDSLKKFALDTQSWSVASQYGWRRTRRGS